MYIVAIANQRKTEFWTINSCTQPEQKEFIGEKNGGAGNKGVQPKRTKKKGCVCRDIQLATFLLLLHAIVFPAFPSYLGFVRFIITK